LKVAIFCPYDFSFPGGVQTQSIDLAESLSLKGHDVTVIAPLSSKNIHNNNQIKFLDLGIPLQINFLGSKSRISINFFKILKIINYIKKNNFEIIHLNEPLSPTFLPIIFFLRKFSIIGTFHAYGDKKHFWYSNFKWFLKFFLNKINIKICVSKSSQKYINNYFDFSSQIIPNGILLSKYNKTKIIPKELRNSDKKILFVGRFEEKRKGFNILLEAFDKLSGEIKNLQLVVIGSGDPKKIKKDILSKNIHFIGHVEQNDLNAFYNNVDIICLPSLENESFGVIILEAMASGKILALSNIISYEALSKKNNYGFLYDSNSSEELYKLLLDLLNNNIPTEINIKNGLKNVQNYSWDYLVSEIIKIYRQLKN
tara:strand:- start:4729 stop:5835 length:1107 start_codon:yes stop_codon:yes gene_type:complete